MLVKQVMLLIVYLTPLTYLWNISRVPQLRQNAECVLKTFHVDNLGLSRDNLGPEFILPVLSKEAWDEWDITLKIYVYCELYNNTTKLLAKSNWGEKKNPY